MMNILILGATGMLGYSLFKNLQSYSQYSIYGSVRTILGKENYFEQGNSNLIFDVDVNDFQSIKRAINESNADIVINCIGLIKQQSVSKQHEIAIQINSLLPHQLASLCTEKGCRLIHFSTDCVFDGQQGMYLETDKPNSSDLYGRSKCLGEVDYGGHLTIRTSIIGHELNSNLSLIDWFLSQDGSINGYNKAIFSGLPTCSIAKILGEHIIPAKDLCGLYQLSADPIDKFSLLKLVSEIYKKKVEIHPNEELVIDRSLDSTKLKRTLSFKVESWPVLISEMHSDYKNRYQK